MGVLQFIGGRRSEGSELCVASACFVGAGACPCGRPDWNEKKPASNDLDPSTWPHPNRQRWVGLSNVILYTMPRVFFFFGTFFNFRFSFTPGRYPY